MKTELVLTLIGEDRPGLVEQVSQLIANRQGQWLDSNFSRLQGKLAGILQISVPSEQGPALEEDLYDLEGQGLRVMIGEGDRAVEDPGYPLRLRFEGQDRYSIVAQIGEVLNRFRVTILSLSSRCTPEPMSAEVIFSADFEVRVPLSVSRDQLGEALEGLAPELMIALESYETAAV